MAKASEGARLRRKLAVAIAEVGGASHKLVAHPRIADLYPEYLFMCHGIVRATVPLMETGVQQARLTAGNSPVSAALADYLERHTVEEAGEDEWLLEDLELLGRDRVAVLARPPSPVVAGLVGAQYYWVLHYHPVSLLGYLAALEGYPPSRELIDDLIARTGHPPAAFKTMIAHAELDPGHKRELDDLLDELPVTGEQSALLGLSAIYSARMLARAIDEVTEEVS